MSALCYGPLGHFLLRVYWLIAGICNQSNNTGLILSN